MVEITSRDNKFLKQVRSLQNKKFRQNLGLYFVEGKRMVEEALGYVPDRVEAFLVSDVFAQKNQEFLHKLDESGKNVYTAKERLFQDVCDTETPQGVAAVLRMPEEEQSLDDKDFLLVLDGVSEPGNLGTIIRTAEAAGVDGVLLLKGCADLYNPKVVRSTMGSLFRVPVLVGVETMELKKYQEKGFYLTATSLYDSVPIGEGKRAEKQMLVIGSEASGVSKEVLALSNQRVRIPMAGKVESLNVAVAAGIAMYAFGKE